MFNKDSWKLIVRIVAIIAFIAVAFYFARLAQESYVIRSIIHDHGYIGAFAVSFFSGFNLVIPVPSIAFLPLMLAAGLNFWTAMILITLGVTLADSVSFFIGKMAKNLTGPTNNKVVKEFKKAERKSSLAPLLGTFLFISFAPFPAEIILVPLGYMEYSFIQVFPVILAGNFIFNLIVAQGIIGLFSKLI